MLGLNTTKPLDLIFFATIQGHHVMYGCNTKVILGCMLENPEMLIKGPKATETAVHIIDTQCRECDG